jgi:hypothetical protein
VRRAGCARLIRLDGGCRKKAVRVRFSTGVPFGGSFKLDSLERFHFESDQIEVSLAIGGRNLVGQLTGYGWQVTLVQPGQRLELNKGDRRHSALSGHRPGYLAGGSGHPWRDCKCSTLKNSQVIYLKHLTCISFHDGACLPRIRADSTLKWNIPRLHPLPGFGFPAPMIYRVSLLTTLNLHPHSLQEHTHPVVASALCASDGE